MTSRVTVAILGLLIFDSMVLWPSTAHARAKSSAEIQEKLDREDNPKKRLNLSLDLTDQILKEMFLDARNGEVSNAHQKLEQYISAIDVVEQSIDENWDRINKKVEIRLRRQLSQMEDHAMAVSYTERPLVEKTVKKIAALHERVLNRIMKPRK